VQDVLPVYEERQLLADILFASSELRGEDLWSLPREVAQEAQVVQLVTSVQVFFVESSV